MTTGSRARRDRRAETSSDSPKPGTQTGRAIRGTPPRESQSVGRDSEPNEGSRVARRRPARRNFLGQPEARNPNRPSNPGNTPPWKVSQSVETASRTKGRERGATGAQKLPRTAPKPGTQTGRTIRRTPPAEGQSVGRRSQPDEGWRTGRNQGGESSSDNPKPATQTGRTIRGTPPPRVSQSAASTSRTKGDARGATSAQKLPRTTEARNPNGASNPRNTRPWRVSQAVETASRTKGLERGATDAQKPPRTTPWPGTQTGRTNRGTPPGESQSVARHNQPDERWRPRRDQGAETSADNRENRLTNPGNTPRGKSVSRSIRAAGRRGNNRGATGGHKPPRTAPRPGTQTGRTIRGTAPAENQSVARDSQPDEG